MNARRLGFVLAGFFAVAALWLAASPTLDSTTERTRAGFLASEAPSGGPTITPYPGGDLTRDSESGGVLCGQIQFRTEDRTNASPVSVASFDAPPGSEGCGTTTVLSTTNTCSGYPTAATRTSASVSKSCTTLSCGSASEHVVTNWTKQEFEYTSKSCYCMDFPERPRWCISWLSKYTKREQEWEYFSLGNLFVPGYGFVETNRLKCVANAVVTPDDMVNTACPALAQYGNLSVRSLSSGQNSCSWIAINGLQKECSTDGSGSCRDGTRNASTSCSTGVGGAGTVYPDCLRSIIKHLLDSGKCSRV